MQFRILVISFFCLYSSLFSLTLKEKFQLASPGDYIVTEQNRVYSLLSLHKITKHTLIFEEISIPSHRLSSSKIDWKEWVQSKAPGHTSWIMYEIDLDRNEMIKCYSFSRNAFLSQEGSDSFLPTLIQLHLNALTNAERKKIGQPPAPGESDLRKVWKPIQYVEGKKMKNTSFDAYRTRWPQDTTELSQKHIDLYFDSNHLDFPFPYWVQISDSSLTFKLHTVDSGRQLNSPQKSFPRKPPEFLGTPQKMGSIYRLNLKAPSYFGPFHLFAVDISSSPQQSIQIPFQTQTSSNTSLCCIDIQEESVIQYLEKDHAYIWVAISQDDPDLYAETEIPMHL